MAVSQLIASLERTGSFPLEVDYNFNTYAELEAYYNNPINKATLHEGLQRYVKVGKEDNSPTLYVATDNGGTFVWKRIASEKQSSVDIVKLKEISDKSNYWEDVT